MTVQTDYGVPALRQRIAQLEAALSEAIDWLDNDLAHAPDTPTSMADRELISDWRKVLDA